jgi:heme/copper-type cytochrome/quinol oxidase subunit 4
MTTVEAGKSAGMGKDLVVYLCLLALAGVQFAIAFQNIDTSHMLARMLGVAIVEAALAVLFFMHLWTEKRGFALFVLVFTVFVLLTMQYGWTDSTRMVVGAPFAK